MKKFLVCLVFTALSTTSLQAVELRYTNRISAGVYLTAGAINPDSGMLDPAKIYVYGRPSADVTFLTLTASIVALKGKEATDVGVLSCHYGLVKARQLVTYAGVSCDMAPLGMYVPKGARLVANINAVFERVDTSVVRTRVRNYPPGK